MRVVTYLQEHNAKTILLEFRETSHYHGYEMHFLKNPIRYAFQVQFLLLFFVNIIILGSS